MIPTRQYDQFWKAHRAWLEQFPAQIIFTGHVQLGKSHFDGNGNPFYESLTVQKLDKSVEYFNTKASRKIFGTSAVKNGTSLSYMGRIEGGLNPNVTGDPRLHVHLGFSGIPQDRDLTEICHLLCRLWEEGYWGYRDTKAEICYGEAWKNYFLKKLSPYGGETFITNVPFGEHNKISAA